MTGVVAALGALAVASLLGPGGAGAAWAEATPPPASRWSAGAAVGFLANSPDGPEPAVAGYVAYEVSPGLSVGPLVQLAGPGNDRLAGLSLQARYRWSPGSGGRLALMAQGGLGVLWADIEDTDRDAAITDTTFVIPLGVGVEYAVTPRVALTADLLVNLTSLGDRVQTGGQEVDLQTYVMPGLFLGVRF
jgi:opacity protein-like surface antigen